MGLSLQSKICAWCFSALRQSSGARFGDSAYGNSACGDSAYGEIVCGDRPVCGEIAYGNRLYRNILLYPPHCVQSRVFVTPRMMKIVTARAPSFVNVLRCQGTPLSEYVVIAVLCL